MEILNTVNSGGEGGALFFGGMVAAFALLFFTGAIYCIRDKDLGFGVLLTVLGAGMLLLSYLAFVDYTTPDPVRYEVLITDMSAFDTEKYEIIEQRGKVFVVQEVVE